MGTDMLTPADIAAVTGNNGGGFGDGNGAWWLIVLFIFAFCGWGNGNGFGGGGSQGAADNYVLASDFATLQRQIDSGVQSLERKGDSITNGLCDGFFNVNTTLLNGFNGTNNAITTSGYETRNAINTLMSQLANCCCEIREGISGVNYNMAMNVNGLQKAISDGFCQTNFNAQNNTRDIIDAIRSIKEDAKDDKIATLTAMVSDLKGQASQNAQTCAILSALQPQAQPAYIVPNPNAVYSACGCGVN